MKKFTVRLSAALLLISTTAYALNNDLPTGAKIGTNAIASLANKLSDFAVTTSAQLKSVISDATGSGALYFQGGAAGTPSSITLTNGTGLPVGGIASNTANTLAGFNGSGVASDVTIGTNLTLSGGVLYGTNITSAANLFTYGDSVTCGVGAGNNGSCNTNGYANMMATDSGASLTNRAISGEQACDTAYIEVFPNENPSLTSNAIYTLNVGINDAQVKGSGAYEVNYNNCDKAMLTWLSIPQENKKFLQNCTLTGTWSVDANWPSGVGEFSSANGSTATCSITTTGGPVYIWYLLADGLGGSFTYTVDGGSASAPVNTAPATNISTQNGVTHGESVVRITGVAAGSHTIVITMSTSPSGSGPAISLAGIGTPPSLNYWRSPVVFSTGVIKEQNDAIPTVTAQYDADAAANAALLAADGLKVRFVDLRPYVNATTDMWNNYHPNSIGHRHLAEAIEAVAEFPSAMSGGGGGSGTVTSASVVSANGFSGSVATATTTPAITLSTTISGILKGSAGALVAATSGTDYAPATTGTSLLKALSGGFANAVAGTDYVAPGGALGTPSSGVATNLTGTASGLTAGTVITNANLTGDVTSSGNATTLALSVPHAWTNQQNFAASAITSTSNSIAWNLNTAQVATHTATENTTLANPTNMVAGGTYIFIYKQNSSSAKTLAFGTAYKWPSGAGPTVTATLSATDVFTFISDGTNMFGSYTQDER